MILDVTHRTSYRYGQPVSIAHHVVHLSPRTTDRQDVLKFDLEIRPKPTLVRHAIDFFGNAVHVVTLEQEHAAFIVTAKGTVEIRSRNPIEPKTTEPIEALAAPGASGPDAGDLDVRQFLFESPAARCPEELLAWSASLLAPHRPVLEAALELNGEIHRSFTYDAKATTVSTSVAECFTLRRGVCQDFTHLMLAALRGHRIPARYVSGYLRSRAPAGQQRLIGSDASHAWVQVWAPPYGWVDLDPTNDLIPGEEHVTLAFGRDFSDVSPINGVIFGGGAHAVDVEVDVLPNESAATPPASQRSTS